MIELWAGPECTIARIGEMWFDQLEATGHARRMGDLDRLAWLGVRAVRQPVLWEKGDRAWADRRIHRLEALGIRPIIGLVHHGSGPPETSLVDPTFPDRLARYAATIAARHPRVLEWTPVNEPLTTARFSGLYGHWYPHGKDDRTFVRILLAECVATARAMRAIRSIVPGAKLVQTDDLGITSSTPKLEYQAHFDNLRRWLGFDLLFGRVGKDHPMREYLEEHDADRAWLDELEAEPCPPNVVGINHYATSDRFLDEVLERHDPRTHGGNRRDRYADTETVRVPGAPRSGFEALLVTASERYGVPVALTEVHLGCTREEQVRWLVEAWKGARAAENRGANVAGVTIWSAFGACDWDSLLANPRGHYEPGAFDIRAPEPRPTAIAFVARELARSDACDHPVLATPGWWCRRGDPIGPPILVCGGGTLGTAIAAACATRGLAHVLLRRASCDFADPLSVARAFELHRPWAVINAAGWIGVDDAELDIQRCRRENLVVAQTIAAACHARGSKCVTFSSDLVFDGKQSMPYVESAPVGPVNIYGSCKAQAESAVLGIDDGALVIRTAAFFSPGMTCDFVSRALRALSNGERFPAASDVVVSPTFVPDLAHATLDLLVDGESGIWHVANQGALAWAELARLAAALAGIAARSLEAKPNAELGWLAPRPAFSALASVRGTLLPPLEDALSRAHPRA